MAYRIPGSKHAVGVLEEAARVLYGEQAWPALEVAIVSAGLLKRPGVMSLLTAIIEDGSAPESAIKLAIETFGELPIDDEDLDLIRALQQDRSVDVRMTAFAVDADLTGNKTAIQGFLDEMAYAKCVRSRSGGDRKYLPMRLDWQYSQVKRWFSDYPGRVYRLVWPENSPLTYAYTRLPYRLWDAQQRRFVRQPSQTLSEQEALRRKQVLWTGSASDAAPPQMMRPHGKALRDDGRAQIVFEFAERIKVYRPGFQGAFEIAGAILEDKFMYAEDGSIDEDAVTGCIAAMVDLGRQATAPLVRVIVYSKDVRRDLALDGLAMVLGKEESQTYLKRRARLEPDEAIKATLLWAVDALDGPPLPIPAAEPAPQMEVSAKPPTVERFEQVEVRATENQKQPLVTKIRLQKGAYFVLEPYPQDSWTGGGSKTGVYCNFMGYADRGHKWMRLNYQIGSQPPVPVVAGLKYRVESASILKLFCYDGRTDDNKGAIRVLIKVSQ